MQAISTEAIQRGDAGAFTQLFQQNRDKLLHVAYRMTSSRAEAEDAVQEAFLNSWRNSHQFTGAAKPSTWLHRVTVNAALMRLRTKRRKGAESLEDWPASLVESLFSSGEKHGTTTMEEKRVRAEIGRALSHLRPLDRNIVRMRFWEELSMEEIGLQTNMSAAAVKTRLHRAKAVLAELLHACFTHKDN